MPKEGNATENVPGENDSGPVQRRYVSECVCVYSQKSATIHEITDITRKTLLNTKKNVRPKGSHTYTQPTREITSNWRAWRRPPVHGGQLGLDKEGLCESPWRLAEPALFCALFWL